MPKKKHMPAVISKKMKEGTTKNKKKSVETRHAASMKDASQKKTQNQKNNSFYR